MWQVSFRTSAERELKLLPEWAIDDLLELADELAQDPFPALAIELRRNAKVYRVYFGRGRYRLIYRVDERNRRVRIMRVRERPTAYKGLE